MLRDLVLLMSFLQNTDAFQQDPYLMERKRQAIAAEEARARMGAASAYDFSNSELERILF